jgi:hypothetical protein
MLKFYMLKLKYPILRLNNKAKKLVDDYNKDLDDKKIELVNFNCISCEKEEKLILFNNECHGIKHKTVICKNCGFIYSDPRMTEVEQNSFYKSDLYREIYDSSGAYINYIEKANAKIKSTKDISNLNYNSDKYTLFGFYGFTNKYVDLNLIDNVCEIGAGSGANLLPFKNKGKGCFGVELSNGLIENAKNYDLNLAHSDVDEIKQKIDLFLLIHVLEHLHDPIKYLKKIAKRGPSYILIEVPGIVDRFGDIVQNAHNFYFSKNTLVAICSKAGLKCVAIDHYSDRNWLIGLFKVDIESDETYSYDYSFEYEKNLKIIYFQKFKHIFPTKIKSFIKKFIWIK